MNDTGIFRRIDDLGRIVVPVELRRQLGMEKGKLVEVWKDADRLVARLATADSIAVTRPIDDLGRFVLPRELLHDLGWNVNDQVRFLVGDGRVILTKYYESCALCGEAQPPAVRFKKKPICAGCLTLLKGY